MEWLSTFLVLIGAVYLMAAVRIAQENERFAVFTLGRFVKIVGPGLQLVMLGGVTRLARVALGMRGAVLSSEIAEISGQSLPYRSKEPLEPGSAVRVVGFDTDAVEVARVRNVVVCEKCGHENHL